MHKINVKILGSSSFVSTLNELKMFLKFNPLPDNLNDNSKITLFHIDVLQNKKQKDYIFSNSSIRICAGNRKDFNENFVILTEKEIQLLDLFLNYKKPISKEKILSSVWNYSPDADTHTVETHIYRLRKKINDKFKDEKFILNNKNGYYL